MKILNLFKKKHKHNFIVVSSVEVPGSHGESHRVRSRIFAKDVMCLECGELKEIKR